LGFRSADWRIKISLGILIWSFGFLYIVALKDIEKQLYGMSDDDNGKQEDIFEEPEIQSKKTKWQDMMPPSTIGNKEVEVKLPKRPPSNFFQPKKKPILLYILAGILAIGLIGEGIILATKYFSRDASIALSFSLPEEVLSADPFDLRIDYKNNSSNLLRDVTLVVELPEGVKSLADAAEGSFVRRELGDLGTGSDSNQTLRLIAMGDANKVINFKATLQYDLPGFSSRFEKSIKKEISISGPALSFDLVLPQGVISNEEFMFQVEYANNTEHTISGVKLQAFYPLGFNYVNSSIPTTEGNNIWALGDLPAKTTGKLSIAGNVIGQTGSFYDFGGQMSLTMNNQTISLDKKTAGLTIQTSPLRMTLYVNNATDYVAHAGEDLEYRLDYQNNTQVALEEVIIKATLDSDMFDLSSVQSSGYYDSGTRRVIFNAGNTEALRLVNRGDGGSVSFKVRLKENFSIKKLNDKNFVVKVQAQLESPSVAPNTNLLKTTGVTEIISKIAGKADLISLAYFRDANSGIVNKGTLPLTVGKATNFTVHWKVINYSNDLSSVVIRSVLPQGVTWTGQVAGNYGESAPQYNERTGEVIWEIPKLPATTGIALPAREAIFQIAVTPSLNQVGNYINLLGKTIFTSKDDFVDSDLNLTAKEIDSRLENDSTVKDEEGKVVM
jgi:hypothetical protein